jgi:site-specific DNA-methyltransferase (adenine-specific)
MLFRPIYELLHYFSPTIFAKICSMESIKERAGRNKTITLGEDETDRLATNLIRLTRKSDDSSIVNKTIQQDFFEVVHFLPDQFVDLLFIDPPYNLNKKFNSNSFKKMCDEDYEQYVDSWLSKLVRTLKPTASVYICCDWKSSSAVERVMSKYFVIRSRITWEREKGRGAKSNWKNCSEDIWYGTMSDDYHFDVDAVKLKKKVIAPYRNNNGEAKDWLSEENGNYRLTSPSNLWTDISIPFWSMPENTDHPTQKPEKLLAKILLASSKRGDMVLDPFLGSGTTSVVAKKLGRKYCGIELDNVYACLAEKRLEMADNDASIQGYCDGVFWERNSLVDQKKSVNSQARKIEQQPHNLFSLATT